MGPKTNPKEPDRDGTMNTSKKKTTSMPIQSPRCNIRSTILQKSTSLTAVPGTSHNSTQVRRQREETDVSPRSQVIKTRKYPKLNKEGVDRNPNHEDTLQSLEESSPIRQQKDSSMDNCEEADTMRSISSTCSSVIPGNQESRYFDDSSLLNEGTSGAMALDPNIHPELPSKLDETRVKPTMSPRVAKLDLNQFNNIDNIPENTKQIYITCSSSVSPKVHLSKLNPFKIADEITAICGPVKKVDHKKSGSLLITVNNTTQLHKLLKIQTFLDLAVDTNIAWSAETCQGKIYAPQFLNEDLETLLEMLTPTGVVAVRKLFQDPAKSASPLYVLTFLGNKCPPVIKAGYTVIKVDTYFSSPLQCRKCHIFGHYSHYCSGAVTCRRCGKKGHKHEECIEEELSCRNCKEKHEANSKQCSTYRKELEICKIKAARGVTFEEARRIQENRNATTENATHADEKRDTQVPDIYSRVTFPQLRHQNVGNKPRLMQENYSQEYEATSPIIDREEFTQCGVPQSTKPKAADIRNRRNNVEDEYNANEIPNSQTNAGVYSSWAAADVNKNVPQYHRKQNANLQNHVSFTVLYDLAAKILPLVIKLFLSKDITSKIECFIELGTLLKSDTVVSDALENLGLTSIPSTQ